MRRAAQRPVTTAMALVVAMTAFLAGCAGTATGDGPPPGHHVEPTAPPPARPIGGDRDAHGCLAPAGYAWCARERACVRPWELAKQAGFDNSAEGFAAYCASTAAPATP